MQPKSIVEGYKVGQLIRINTLSDRPDKRLVGLNSSMAVITEINSASVNVKLHSQRIGTQILEAVSPNDIRPHCEETNPVFHITATHHQAAQLILMFNSCDEIIEAAIAARSLSI